MQAFNTNLTFWLCPAATKTLWKEITCLKWVPATFSGGFSKPWPLYRRLSCLRSEQPFQTHNESPCTSNHLLKLMGIEVWRRHFCTLSHDNVETRPTLCRLTWLNMLDIMLRQASEPCKPPIQSKKDRNFYFQTMLLKGFLGRGKENADKGGTKRIGFKPSPRTVLMV